ncbi:MULTISPECIES: molybdopterin-binding protein [unclassified Campylobacter]|uniref:TOBE domain-containing protein n=1 Tax=unclassified Campylobacter TaxID=2593542 RepID=UPI001237CA58|nr:MULTISPECIES: TOBE domain-containing protein [unclassified Campylobacter]KAA6227260.1 ModE family transcriptional regulator [Campylobacter sp. LR286c]KAA6227867.1 ModE family transcriptional regulator [Campylobacter sp. LR185c]KAA6228275.1 ModE family transcriptional regulator [Campylobacter sp. LR196d]KAA6229275.1 ModE family transcriptional regulator [Campylobacter sp. LR291e]KAA6231081.1 ModE family transcriptional regulator [Campylobacter sp. LR264d]
MLSSRNILKVNVKKLKSDSVLTQVSASLGENKLRAIITSESAKRLKLSKDKAIYFIFKASSVILAKEEFNIKTSAANELTGIISEVREGAVNAEIDVKCGDYTIVAIITMQSLQDLALKQGDKVSCLIKANNVIVGVDK